MKWDFLQLNSENFQKKFKISFEKKQKKKKKQITLSKVFISNIIFPLLSSTANFPVFKQNNGIYLLPSNISQFLV